MHFSHLANKLRSKITKFSGLLSQDLDKTARHFIKEAVYGIMTSQSVMLTDMVKHTVSGPNMKAQTILIDQDDFKEILSSSFKNPAEFS